jgi:zinc protease
MPSRPITLFLMPLLAAAALAGSPRPLAAQRLAVERHKLANGLTVLTHEDHSLPMITFFVLYHVGSDNERPGNTGMSHLFEHMFFNGSGKFKPKEFDHLLEAEGGLGSGAATVDYTMFHETFPPAALDTVLDLESDRMLSLAVTPQNLEQERAIVKEERRFRVDNDPVARMEEELRAAAFVIHPYGWPISGWMEDLDTIRLADAQRYFDTYYSPNNATLVLTGDFATAELMKRIEAYFGKLPARAKPDPVVVKEPEQQGERRITLVKDAALPGVMIGFKTPAASHPDTPVLQVLATILGQGQSSRLYRKLVYGQLATEVWVDFLNLTHPSLIEIYAQAQSGKTAAECEAAIYEVLRDLQASGAAAEELQKAKNQLRVDVVRNLQEIFAKAYYLGLYEVRHGDYSAVFSVLDKYDAVTPDDIKRVAADYFVKQHRTVVTLELAEEGKGAADE